MGYPILECSTCGGDMRCVGYNYKFPPKDVLACVIQIYKYQCDNCGKIDRVDLHEKDRFTLKIILED